METLIKGGLRGAGGGAFVPRTPPCGDEIAEAGDLGDFSGFWPRRGVPVDTRIRPHGGSDEPCAKRHGCYADDTAAAVVSWRMPPPESTAVLPVSRLAGEEVDDGLNDCHYGHLASFPARITTCASRSRRGAVFTEGISRHATIQILADRNPHPFNLRRQKRLLQCDSALSMCHRFH